MRLLLPLLLLPLLSIAADPAAPRFEYPLIKNHGGIVVLPEAAEQPRPNSRMLLDLTSVEERGGVLKGLDRAAAFVNMYAQANAGPSQGMQLAVVIHGPATQAVLTDAAYAQHHKSEQPGNPHRALIHQLKEAGVEFYVCGQALARHHFHADSVLPEVTIAVSAATVHVNKQMDGYVLVP